MTKAAALLVALGLAACKAPQEVPQSPLPQPAVTMVRLHNATGSTLEDIRVTFARIPVDYGDLAPGATSEYRPAEGAYRYAMIEARIGGEPFVLQPIDYVGETPLGPGRFTYRLEPWPEQRGFVVAEATRDP